MSSRLRAVNLLVALFFWVDAATAITVAGNVTTSLALILWIIAVLHVLFSVGPLRLALSDDGRQPS